MAAAAVVRCLPELVHESVVVRGRHLEDVGVLRPRQGLDALNSETEDEVRDKLRKQAPRRQTVNGLPSLSRSASLLEVSMISRLVQ